MFAAEAAAAVNEIKVPEEAPGLVLRGIEEFNRGEFFEAHEYLEAAWRRESLPIRSLYQGILQVGVGFYHQQNGNWRGATSLLRNGIRASRGVRARSLRYRRFPVGARV